MAFGASTPSSGAGGAVSRGRPGLETCILLLVALAASQVHAMATLGSLAVGGPLLIWRHRKDPSAVVGIVVTIFCSSPFFRRLHDFKFGYQPSSAILAAPYASIGMVGLLVVQRLNFLRREHFIPVLVSTFAVIYAYSMGVLEVGISGASISLLQYLAGPLVFLLLNTRQEHFDIAKLHGWLHAIIGVTSLYGLYQYATAPPWDAYWLTSTGLTGAGGEPFPFEMRTWSTLNSMAPFSYFLTMYLIMGICTKKYLWVAPFALATLSTTLGRSAWGTTALGWFLALLLLRSRDRLRLAAILFAMVGIGAAALAVAPADATERLAKRLETITNLKNDNSYTTRMHIAQSAGSFSTPLGVGLGSVGTAARVGPSGGMPNFDNGFIAIAYTFGWIGSLFYFGGFLGGLCYALYHIRILSSHAVLFVCAATAQFGANIFEDTMSDFRGVLIWLAVGAAIASARAARTNLHMSR